jgi:transcriptional regulator with XRE-family HTH domain
MAVNARGRLAAARKSAGYTQESLAAALSIDRSTVIRWEAGERRPAPYLRPKLARLLGRTPDQLAALIGESEPSAPLSSVRVEQDDLLAAFTWLDRSAGWRPGRTGQNVAALTAISVSGASSEGGPLRSQIAEALAAYYRRSVGAGHLARFRWDGDILRTSVVAEAGWIAPALSSCLLRLETGQAETPWSASRKGAEAAVERLAASARLGVRVADSVVYRLLDIDVSDGLLSGVVSLAPFVEYALTLDLLETELVEALASGSPIEAGRLPLRDEYLPDLASLLDFRGRLCAGGALALCAIARPPDRVRGAGDYALLVQERSGQVINGAGRLSVIPKGFHQPMTDYRADTRIEATLLREMEEELFGRVDVDNTAGPQRAADPMHPSRLSEPMAWLLADPSRMRIECTGFGVNLMTGNYEFAGLVVIDDDEFWAKFGGRIEANWETSGLRQYSSLDRDLLNRLVVDEAWGSEGLFAFLLGMRRLGEVGGSRCDLPDIEWLSSADS